MDAEDTQFVEDWQKWAAREAAEKRKAAQPVTVVRDVRGYVARGD